MYAACREPGRISGSETGVKMDARIHIDVDLKEASDGLRKALSALLTEKDYKSSLSLVKSHNETFLETRFSRFYTAENINETSYDQLEILSKADSPDYDYFIVRRAFINFVRSQNVTERAQRSVTNSTITDNTVAEEVDILEACTNPHWTVRLYSLELSTTEYTPLQLPVATFTVEVRYIQNCRKVSQKCDDIELALEE